MAGEKILTGLSRAFGGVLGEYGGAKISDIIDVGLWHMTKPLGALDLLLTPLSQLEDASPDETLGYSPSGIRTVFEKFVDTMVALAPILGKEVVDELVGEMLQEGISNSIQTSFGGSLQTLLNMRRGGFPGFQDNIRNYTDHIDRYNTLILRYICAETGLNAITTALEIANSLNTNIYNKLRPLKEQTIALTSYINNHTIGHITRFITTLDVLYTRFITLPLEVSMFYAEIVRRVAEEHLARVNELEDALENIYAYYTGGIVNDEVLLETEMLKIKAELEATETIYDEYIQALEDQYSRIINTISTEISNITSKIDNALKVLYTKLIESINQLNDETLLSNELDNALAKAKNLLYGVVGYRELNKVSNSRYRTYINFNKV